MTSLNITYIDAHAQFVEGLVSRDKELHDIVMCPVRDGPNKWAIHWENNADFAETMKHIRHAVKTGEGVVSVTHNRSFKYGKKKYFSLCLEGGDPGTNIVESFGFPSASRCFWFVNLESRNRCFDYVTK